MGIMEIKEKQILKQIYKSNITCHMLLKIQSYISVKNSNFSNMLQLPLVCLCSIIYLAFQNNIWVVAEFL